MTAEWDAFVASLDPVAVEGNRFGVPSKDERPGSPADRRMRLEHQARVIAFQYRLQFPLATDEEIAAATREARHHTPNQYRQSPEGRAALRQKRNNEHRRAA